MAPGQMQVDNITPLDGKRQPAIARAPRSSGDIALLVAAALVIAAVVVFIAGMGALMAGHMNGGMMGMMGGGGSRSAQTPAVASASEITIEIRDFDFTPRDLTVKTGTKVTWINRDAAPHTATAKGEWDTGTLDQGHSATLTFDKPGTYDYFCVIHPSMKGTLTVR